MQGGLYQDMIKRTRLSWRSRTYIFLPNPLNASCQGWACVVQPRTPCQRCQPVQLMPQTRLRWPARRCPFRRTSRYTSPYRVVESTLHQPDADSSIPSVNHCISYQVSSSTASRAMLKSLLSRLPLAQRHTESRGRAGRNHDLFTCLVGRGFYGIRCWTCST